MLKTIYQDSTYTAQVSPDTSCVVHRVAELPNGQRLTTHVGEKLPSQDWREVKLMGCPDEIRVEIVKAWNQNQICQIKL